MTVAALPYFHDGGPQGFHRPPLYPSIDPRLLPWGESWEGSASGAATIVVPGPTGAGGPSVGLWVYLPSAALGAGDFAIWTWDGPSVVPGDPLHPTQFQLIWSTVWLGFQAAFQYYDATFTSSPRLQPTQKGFTPGGNSPVVPGNTWFWVAVSVNTSAARTMAVRLAVTIAGAGSPMFDQTVSGSPFVVPSTGADTIVPSATLTLGAPVSTGALCARFHYLPHNCPPSSSPPPLLAPPSPGGLHLMATGGGSEERIYNPDGELATTQYVLSDASGNHLDLAQPVTNDLILNTAGPPGTTTLPIIPQPALAALAPTHGPAAGAPALAPTLAALAPTHGPTSGKNSLPGVLTALSVTHGPVAGGN